MVTGVLTFLYSVLFIILTILSFQKPQKPFRYAHLQSMQTFEKYYHETHNYQIIINNHYYQTIINTQ